MEKSPLTYQFLTFGISPRNMTYQPGIWHISVVWHISQDFDISVRILYRLPLQYKPFCTVFHCSSKKYFFVSSVHPISSIHDPTRRPPGVCLAARATVVVTRSPSAWRCCQRDEPSVFASMRAARRASRCGMRLPRPTQPSARARSTSTDDISVYKHCCIRDARAHDATAHPECNLSTPKCARARTFAVPARAHTLVRHVLGSAHGCSAVCIGAVHSRADEAVHNDLAHHCMYMMAG